MLDKLLARAQEIETAILNTTNQLHALAGHKTEIQHWISQLKEPVEENISEPVADSEPPAVS